MYPYADGTLEHLYLYIYYIIYVPFSAPPPEQAFCLFSCVTSQGEEGHRARCHQRERPDAQEMQECAAMASGSDYVRVRDDGECCLERLLGHSPPLMGNRTLRKFIQGAAGAEVSKDSTVFPKNSAAGKRWGGVCRKRKNKVQHGKLVGPPDPHSIVITS